MDFKEVFTFYKDKRVLITGHTGFKGAWLSRILTNAGAKVTGYALNPPTDPALFDAAGVKEKMPVSRQKELSRLILVEYPYLKVTELLLFFHRLKCGRYGRFYGMVDALFITSALVQFMEERRAETKRYLAAREKEEKPEKKTVSGGISYQEYLLLKEKRQKQDNHG